ncbi:MAG: formylglycine-generating enzyme family protein [Kiritimatiellae bacterium]|nr:formylglycine-generating enzyme family protein [Kiritimatiellia bacterium]
MKKTMVLAGLVAAMSVDAAVIEQVIVRQQWPWTTDVKVEYKVTGVTSPVNIAVRAFDGDAELDSSNLESAISGRRYGIAEDGVGYFVIDPVKAFGKAKVALANFKVKLSLTPAAENVGEVVYKVFDLATGSCRDITRADFYNKVVEDGEFVTDYTSLDSSFRAPSADLVGDVLIWTGVTNNVKYKTTHLVMRKIPAAGKVWTMGAPPGEPGGQTTPETNHLVKLTKDYFVGVFEMTQKQYTLLVGNNPSTRTDQENADVLPANRLVCGRETANNNNTAWEAVKRIRTKTGNSSFCLPSDAQWEFACRAGAVTSLYSGRNVQQGGLWSGCDGDASKLAWFDGNSDSQQHAVGLKLPNAFGLYDTLGNVLEWTRDAYASGADYVATFGAGWQPGDVVVDPANTSSDSTLVVRGGAFGRFGAYIRCASRLSMSNWTSVNECGMRMALMDDAE